MFSAHTCFFAPNAKFKDKFVFNGGAVSPFASPQFLTILPESSPLDSSLSTDSNCVIDWWILDCIRLRQLLPVAWYQPLADNPFLTPFRFHFFTLDHDDTSDTMQNSLVPESQAVPLDLIKGICKRFGATVSDTIDPATTHIVSQFQCEHLLPTQLLGPVHFVTLPFLLKILNAGVYSDPSDAIDFPCPIHPIPSANSINACLSGFSPADKHLLASQLSLMGIPTSPHLSPSVTHLICARFHGPKYEMARKCNIRIVDRTWIDTCYRSWRLE